MDVYEFDVFHVASMARSGETLLLKLLDAHPEVKVSHNLFERESEKQKKLFEVLRKNPKPHITLNENLVKYFSITPGAKIILKQGVWEHKFPFFGVILARNPVSIYSSLKRYDHYAASFGEPSREAWLGNEKRLVRWMSDIDLAIARKIADASPLEQFCLFYNRRMLGLKKTNLDVMHYETLVSQPRFFLSRFLMVANLSVEYIDSILEAHACYPPGFIGHGKNDLSKSIDPSSLMKYKSNISISEFNYIASHTEVVTSLLGYTIDYDKYEYLL